MERQTRTIRVDLAGLGRVLVIALAVLFTAYVVLAVLSMSVGQALAFAAVGLVGYAIGRARG